MGVSGGKQEQMRVESRQEGGSGEWAGVVSQVKGDGIRGQTVPIGGEKWAASRPVLKKSW